MNKLKKGDEVIVIAGKDKGKVGIISQIHTNKSKANTNRKVSIDGLNLSKKHTKPNPNNNDKGGIVLKAMPLDISNLKIYNKATGKGDKVGIRKLEDGRLVRYFKSNNEVIDV